MKRLKFSKCQQLSWAKRECLIISRLWGPEIHPASFPHDNKYQKGGNQLVNKVHFHKAKFQLGLPQECDDCAQMSRKNASMRTAGLSNNYIYTRGSNG